MKTPPKNLQEYYEYYLSLHDNKISFRALFITL